MFIDEILSRADRLCCYTEDNIDAVKYAFSRECLKSYSYDKKTGISSISRNVFNMQRFIIEFKIGDNVLFIDKTDELNKEFLEMCKMHSKVVICRKEEDIFNAPRGAIFIDETGENEELSGTSEFVIGSQSLLIACTNGIVSNYVRYINFEFNGRDYISKVK